MGMTSSTRRALIGGIGLAPIAAMAASAATFPAGVADPAWNALVQDFYAKKAAASAATDADDDMMDVYRGALEKLPPEPVEPRVSNNGPILDKTLRELRDACDTPEHQTAYQKYEADHAAWEFLRKRAHAETMGITSKEVDRTAAAEMAALSALAAYRTSSPAILAEKIEIITTDYRGCEVPLELVVEMLADARHLARGTIA